MRHLHKVVKLIAINFLIIPELALAKIPDVVTDYLRNERHRVSEDGVIHSQQSPGTLDFVRGVVQNWREIVDDLPSVAGDGRKQSLIIVAGEYLPPQEYVDFVDSLCERREQGKLVPEALCAVLWADMAKGDFLSYNYDNPRVGAVIDKIEDIVTRDFPNEWNEYFTALKSGKLKVEAINRRKADNRAMPESYAENNLENYQKLVGGSITKDIKLIATKPAEAVASLASKNRSKWSMYAALLLIVGGIVVLRIIFNRRKNIASLIRKSRGR